MENPCGCCIESPGSISHVIIFTAIYINLEDQDGEGHVARMGKDRSPFKILTDNPTGKISLVMPRRIWGTI